MSAQQQQRSKEPKQIKQNQQKKASPMSAQSQQQSDKVEGNKANPQKQTPQSNKDSNKQLQVQQTSKEGVSKSSTSNDDKESNSSRQPPQSQRPKLSLFDHLPSKSAEREPSIQGDSSIHPAIVKLGYLYQTGSIRDDDDRAYALLVAFHNVILDYKTPPNKRLSGDLDKYVKSQVQFLVNCRQHSMAMGNIIKFIRFTISTISSDISEAEAKTIIAEKIQAFLEERIIYARENIYNHCNDIIRDGDVILTFGSSPVLRGVLHYAAAVKGRSFTLIVVDSLPHHEGLRTLSVLSPHVKCVYSPLAGAAKCMNDATKVLLGASALLSNGTVFAPAGSGMIACLAKNKRVPVIFAAESYKFCEKVQLDSIVFNELGDYKELIPHQVGSAEESKSVPRDGTHYKGADIAGCGPFGSIFSAAGGCEVPSPPPPSFDVLNILYDLTSMRNISAVITEVGLIPPTSIPVLIRELRQDQK